jgi:hypothetical protein
VTEGNSGDKVMTFTISLSQAVDSDVTYTATTANGTATSVDYAPASLSGQTIPAGQLSKTFSVTIKGDTTVELDESVALDISAVTGPVVVGNSRGVGTILNDD